MASIPATEWHTAGELYKAGLPMREVANKYNVSIGAVVYVLRKLAVPRRSFAESFKIRYESQPASFSIRDSRDAALEAMGAMLYWAEGFKAASAYGIDFANSDPDMALLFLRFLLNRYDLDHKRLHFSLYHYSNQDQDRLIRFWCKKLSVKPAQFKNHYVKKDPQTGKRIMPHGVIHIRYNDKKLLRDMLNLIESYRPT